MDHPLPNKANKVLKIIILGFLLILIRVWILAVVQHEEHLEQARRPKRKVIIDRVERGTIRDRFNTALALNKIQYNAAVCYADIRHIPSARWEVVGGKRVRVQKRLEHIQALSALLAKELDLDAQKIEDIIHAKASLFPQTPFTIKENISEEQYYRLKALECEWAGIRTEKGSARYYPLGKVGCDVLGYMGAISAKQYTLLIEELQTLQQYLLERESGETPVLPKGFAHPLEVRERVKTLQEKAYTLHDWVGKTGVEGQFDADLRGFAGKEVAEVDTKGTFLRKLPGGRKSLAGQRLVLSISAELQEFAERLLIENEAVREVRHAEGEADLSTPWIRGGAIVAMDPNTGEVLALASYPRIDPNDFVGKQERVNQWLENEVYIGEIWDGKKFLERERWDKRAQGVYTETFKLSWEGYLEALLTHNGEVCKALHAVRSAGEAVRVQGDEQERNRFLEHIAHPQDKLLFLDICHLLIPLERVPLGLLPYLNTLSLARYRELNQAACALKSQVKQRAKLDFHTREFQAYRSAHFKEFLKEKRKEEKARKQRLRPYTDYLEQLEKEQFALFWEKQGSALIQAALAQDPLHSVLVPLKIEEQLQLVLSMRSFEELTAPLQGHYRALRHLKGVQLEKHLAAAFYPVSGYGYGRSQAYRQSTPQGSVFKLVVAYRALVERAAHLKNVSFAYLNPLTINDNLQWHSSSNSPEQVIGFSNEGKPIKRLYKGGFLPRSSHSGMGTIDLIGAIEQSSNLYFALLASDHIPDPLQLIQAAEGFGFGEKTGIDIPGEISGSLPKDLLHNRTGLYTFAIGQHSLVVTPLQTAVMLSALANKGKVLKPKIVHTIVGEEPLRDYQDPFALTSYPFKEYLHALGIGFPLFTSTVKTQETPHVWDHSVELKHELWMPASVRTPLIEGMNRVIAGPKGSARPSIIRALQNHPKWAQDFHALKNQLVGKTGTAEILYKQALDSESKARIHNHIWFGGICFSSEDAQKWESPELTVVVYLRFCQAGGKEAAPLAAQMVHKWRSIRAREVGNRPDQPLP